MSKATPDPEELRFQAALQAAFGPRCADFSGDLRIALRQFYEAARQDGLVDAAAGERPRLDVGEPIDHFGALQTGLCIQNNWLRTHNQVRVLLAPSFRSVVVRGDTGEPVVPEAPFPADKFKAHGPYRVVPPVAQKKGSAA